MNHSYRLVWNDASQRYVAAPETARGRGKSRTAKTLAPAAALLGALLALPAWAQAPPVHALPTGGRVVVGQAQIAQNGSQMHIQQDSQKAILQWQGFDIGSAASVRFNQPNASAVALNRVVAGNASQIHGQLSANGQVWLVNPNGVVFGQGSRVNVGGLVASTLDTSNDDFLAGKAQFTRASAAQGGISNQGEITATGDGQGGGLVALLAPTVKNEGIIRAQLGNVVLAGGDRVGLQAGANGFLQVALEPSTVKTLIENKQLIMADGGQVLMTGRAADALSASVVANSGTVQARTLAQKNGRILLLADMQHGEVHAAGTLQASFVETSAAGVHIDSQLKVLTDGGHWLIDPVDMTIDQVKAKAIEAALGDGDVTVTTSNGGIHGAGADKGDIHVNADISYARNKLTLNADNHLNINARIAVNVDGTLALNYGGTAGDPNAVPVPGSNLHVSGQVDFAKAGTDLLSVNGHGYTVINSLDALQAMNSGLGGKYALGGSVDASVTAGWNAGKGFVPIGNGGTAFTGTFDGLGHTINGLTINRSNESYVGLFGYAENATLRNVGLEGGSVTGGSQGLVTYAGGLVGYQDGGSISHAYATGAVTVSSSFSFSSSSYAGGLVGYMARGSISNAYASGAVAASSSSSYAFPGVALASAYAGGLVGYSAGGSISDAYATGAVTASSSPSNPYFSARSYAGGLVGYNAGDSISHAYASGAVKASASNSSNSSSSANTSYSHAGGLVGYLDEGRISDAYATGAVTATSAASAAASTPYSYAGGLVGYSKAVVGTASISNAYATGKVEASATSHFTPSHTYAGGLVGYQDGGSFSHTYATGAVTATSSISFAAGLVSDSKGGSIENSFYATTDADGVAINRSGISLSGVQGKTFAELQQLATFAGWDMDDQGGTGRTWRIYEGSTTPLLRSFLKGVTVTATATDTAGKTYDGSAASVGATYTTDVAGSTLDGSLRYSTTDKNAGTYSIADGTLKVGGMHSGQQGYDISYANSTPDLSLTIGRATLSVTGTTVAGKTYDGDTTAKAQVGKLEGLVGDERLGVSVLSSSFDNKNAGGRTVTVGYELVNGTNGGLASNYTVTATQHDASIAQKALSVTGTTVDGKTYDGDTTAKAYAGQLEGLVGDERLNVNVASSNFNDKNAGDRTVTVGYELVNGTNGGLASNYTVTATQHDATIAQKALSVTGTTVDGKTYDGDTTAKAHAGQLQGLVGDERLNVNVASSNFNDKNAGDRTVTVGYELLNGTNGGLASNYTVAATQHDASIARKALNVTGTTVEGKTYDGDTTASAHAGQLQGLVGDERLGVSVLSSSFDNKNAGERIVTVGYELANGSNGGLASNYTVTATQHDATIAQKALSVTGTTVDGKTYDGDTTAKAYAGQLEGLVGDERLGVSVLNSNFNDKNAGDRTVTVGYELANGGNGGLASNYTVTATQHDATIAQKALSVTGTTVDGKTYDGDTTAKAHVGQLQGLVGDEQLGVSVLNSNFNDKNAGDQTVTVGYGLANGGNGGLASNYTVTDSSHKATIAQKALSVTGTTVDGKTYDGDTTAKAHVGHLQGLVGDEQLGVSVLGSSFDNKNTGDRTVTVGYGLADGGNGGLASNYTVAATQHDASIARKALNVTGTTVDGKTYDGDTTASAHAGQLQGLVGDERLGVNVASSNFDGKNAGERTVTVGYGLANGGNGGLASNYTVVETRHSASIEKATLTLAAATDHKTYDGSTTSNAAVRIEGLVDGDRITSLGQSFDSRNAGRRGLQVNSGYAIEDGNGGGNYEVTTRGAEGRIDPRALTIAADNAHKLSGQVLGFDGTEFSTNDGGLVAGETVQSVTLASAGSAAQAGAGSYAIAASNVQGGNGFDAGNYDIRYVDGSLSVTLAVPQPVEPPVAPSVKSPFTSFAARSSLISLAGDAECTGQTVRQAVGEGGECSLTAAYVPMLQVAPEFVRLR
ncbi:YDG domain-containing protein [Acidovorax sp. Be4]|uniref:YDG domain-containing protein n=1 Tax=Acidovorax bellezanensis TaxID=2976702 RepID=A0ABT2PFP1_9BURK|nr:YDG domain-containing protein [Acidovorax sp. Be4]MCT9809184.1 YDG domain-containing protein [Acidovorax sp. Be4]